MNPKNYMSYDNDREAAAAIAKDIIRNEGTSKGWTGPVESEENIGKLLNSYNIRLVHNEEGIWSWAGRR